MPACLVLLRANSQASADTFTRDLALPADGNYSAGSFPVVSTSQSFAGATFDIVYTLSAISNDTGALVSIVGGVVGVGSDNDIDPNHYATLEGSGSQGTNGSTAGGEGLSFTGLAITNFQDNGSGLAAADITDLQLNGLTVSFITNQQDGANISFTGFGNSVANVNLSSSALGTPYEIPLTTLANSSPTASNLSFDVQIMIGRQAASRTVQLEVVGALLGDVDLDDAVTFLDIAPLIALLSTGGFSVEADCDENGFVNFLDISPFIVLLAG